MPQLNDFYYAYNRFHSFVACQCMRWLTDKQEQLHIAIRRMRWTALRRIGNNLLGRRRTTKTSGGILGSTAFRHPHLRLTELGRFCTRTRASTLTRRRLLRFGFSINTPHVHETSEPNAIVAHDRTGRRKGDGNRGNVEVKNKTEPGFI